MAVTETLASTADSAIKEKTKAKKRYLKAKKERRKKRKSAPTSEVKVKSANGGGADVDVASSSSEDGEDGKEVVVAPLVKEKKAKKEKTQDEKGERLSKRRRVQEEPVVEDTPIEAPRSHSSSSSRHSSPESDAVEVASAVEASVAVDDIMDLDEPRVPTPEPSALPSFPQPTQPAAPSRLELASQGLDTALAQAQIIDPTLTSSISLDHDNDPSGLSLKTRTRLKELGITELFAVQTTLLPLMLPSDPLLRSLYLPYDPPSDICVSAPTGSGKTLAYVLPIVETLSMRVVTRLRALIVLPTRDLVTQVRETLEEVGKGRGLKIGTATGQHSFAHEQSQLIADKTPGLMGGSSKVDILICTPGRLIDHLNGTPNFSLQHLRYLVIDEADRLLAQSFQDWLVQVLAATRPPSELAALSHPFQTNHDLPYPDVLAPAHMHLLPSAATDIDEPKASSCQKLLFSATLMSDPAKLRALDLRDPQYVILQSAGAGADVGGGVLDVVMEKFSMPATLSEHMLVCDAARKPLMLFWLVLQHDVRGALVFTKSAESTARLVRLFEFFEAARAGEGKPLVARAYSSDLGVAERKATLEAFKNKEIDLLVASDLISRGIDIAHVAHVVSYDAPVDMRKYVHRVGRTARAGRKGDAWTLVEEQEARYFKEMLRGAGRTEAVARLRVSDKQLEPYTGFYTDALQKLKEVYTREKTDRLI